MLVGGVMARFYERYGFAILWTLTSILGVVLGYWVVVAVATHTTVLPEWIIAYILASDIIVAAIVSALVTYIEQRIQWFGALVTLATFVFGLVTGIRQAKRQLPRRLMQFMTEELQLVYDDSEGMVAAMAYRGANVGHRAQLFGKSPLNRALNTMGDAFRPRWRRSLDEAVTEAGTYIEVTEKRLQHLRDLQAHAQLLRGAVRSAESQRRNAQDMALAENAIEGDFTAAVENPTSRSAGLELRGLSRARLGNLTGALQDFEQLRRHSQRVFCTRGQARALRHYATILRMQSAGSNRTLLRRARRNLNIADRLFEDGRNLGTDDWCERGHNRECYGEVQADLGAVAGSSVNPALTAFNTAIRYFQRAKREGDCARVREQIKRLQSP